MKRRPPPLPRNPRTEGQHRRDVARQILLPLIVAVVGALVALAMVIGAAPAGRSVWADVSLISLIVIGAALGLIPLALLAGLIFGLWYAVRYLPGYSRIAQDYTALAARYVDLGSQKVTAPVIAVNGAAAAVRGAMGQGADKDTKP